MQIPGIMTSIRPRSRSFRQILYRQGQLKGTLTLSIWEHKDLSSTASKWSPYPHQVALAVNGHSGAATFLAKVIGSWRQVQGLARDGVYRRLEIGFLRLERRAALCRSFGARVRGLPNTRQWCSSTLSSTHTITLCIRQILKMATQCLHWCNRL